LKNTSHNNGVKKIEIIPVSIPSNIKSGDRLDILILKSLESIQEKLFDNDILVIAHKVVSKSEGRIKNLENIKPSPKSLSIGNQIGKDARVVKLILNESRDIVRLSKGLLIVETRHGFVCANAGIDQSNVGYDFNHVVLLPIDADRSARKIRNSLRKKTGKDIAVIISDTFGRPFRQGQANVAIGVAGIEPMKSYIGTRDMYGRRLRVTEIAVADELASAAELAMGKTQRVPVVIIRNYKYCKSENASVSRLIRSKENDLFR
jgi:coenzyme F420-0:L-glutamate ligase/coenzyme F420-1:gamma-L-glutamate ligase